MTRRIPIRDVTLNVDVVGHGRPLLLMHGGPGLDLWTLHPFRRCADRFTLVFYDHRCNGRSTGAPASMTWDNLTADAEALRERLGYPRWAVLGHSFGGHVALEYALRYPASVSSLVLLDTGADGVWAQENAPRVLAARGHEKQAELARRWFTGDFARSEWFRIVLRLGPAYYSRPSVWAIARDLAGGGWRTKMRPEALILAGRRLVAGWSVVDRLPELTAPTLVVAGRDDFVFPPECQRELAGGIPHARLRIIDHAGHSPHLERTAETLRAVDEFLAAIRS